MNWNARFPTWVRRPDVAAAAPVDPDPEAVVGAAPPPFAEADEGPPRPARLNERSTMALCIRSPVWKAVRSPGPSVPSVVRATASKASAARRGETRLAICSSPYRDMAHEKLA